MHKQLPCRPRRRDDLPRERWSARLRVNHELRERKRQIPRLLSIINQPRGAWPRPDSTACSAFTEGEIEPSFALGTEVLVGLTTPTFTIKVDFRTQHVDQHPIGNLSKRVHVAHRCFPYCRPA